MAEFTTSTNTLRQTLYRCYVQSETWRIERGTLSAQRVERVTNLDINPVA